MKIINYFETWVCKIYNKHIEFVGLERAAYQGEWYNRTDRGVGLFYAGAVQQLNFPAPLVTTLETVQKGFRETF